MEESMRECERLVKMTERIYMDRSAEEVLNASARLFQLAGGGYAVTRTADGLTVRRGWSPVADQGSSLDGSDTWHLTAKEVTVCIGGSSKGRVMAVEGDPFSEIRGSADTCGETGRGIALTAHHVPGIYSQGLVPTECFSAPAFKPAVSNFTTSPALYDLFFLRMDHLLGLGAQWPSCASYSEYVRNTVHYRDQFSVLNFQGHLDALCVRVQDSTP
jgi:hypothetical protein